MKVNRGNFESNLIFLAAIGLLDDPSQYSKRIVEIGSGTANMIRHLRDLGFTDISGTEISSEYIAYARETFDVTLEQMGGEELRFPDSSVDIVMSFDVFEHIPDSDRHLTEVRRILKLDGMYVFQTPNQFTNIPYEIIRSRHLTRWKIAHCSLHNYWTLRRRFRKHGFTVEFIPVPIVNDYFREKVRKTFGSVGIGLLQILRPDDWPQWLKTNFYCVARKVV